MLNTHHILTLTARQDLPGFSRTAEWTALAALLLGMTLLPSVNAQQVYRIVGPDGKVTFSDQPPQQDTSVKSTAVVTGSGVSAASTVASLPMPLREPVSRFPVTLYTGEGCAPCDSGRNLLNSRGIPYTEKTVNSAEDAAAFKRQTNETALPVITIGAQKIQGFSDAEWSQYLDAAGYPKSSVLPSGYRRAAPSAMVASKPVEATARPAAGSSSATPATGNRRSPARAPAEVPVDPAVQNPGGIRF